MMNYYMMVQPVDIIHWYKKTMKEILDDEMLIVRVLQLLQLLHDVLLNYAHDQKMKM